MIDYIFPVGESYCLAHRLTQPCEKCIVEQERANNRLRFSANLSAPSAARSEGFEIDRNVYPWYAYKGSRDNPSQSREVMTDYEEFLRKEVDYLEDEVQELLQVDGGWVIILGIFITIFGVLGFLIGAFMF